MKLASKAEFWFSVSGLCVETDNFIFNMIPMCVPLCTMSRIATTLKGLIYFVKFEKQSINNDTTMMLML